MLLIKGISSALLWALAAAMHQSSKLITHATWWEQEPAPNPQLPKFQQ